MPAAASQASGRRQSGGLLHSGAGNSKPSGKTGNHGGSLFENYLIPNTLL